MSGPESKVENYLVKQCKMLGGTAEKFTSPSKRAVPDRLCQFDYDTIVFVECKAEGEKPTPAQAEDHRRRRARGHTVRVVDSIESVNRFIEEVKDVLSKLKTLEEVM